MCLKYINPNLVFQKSLLVAKNIEYFDLREVSYTKDQKPTYTKLGVCLPISVAQDLKDILEDSRASRNRMHVRNHQDQYFLFAQTLDPDTTILIVKKLSNQFGFSVFLNSKDVAVLLNQLNSV